MSEKIGHIHLSRKEESFMLGGKEIGLSRDYSEKTAQTIDEEVKNIIDKAYDKAYHLLENHLAILHEIVNVLLDKEVITGEKIADIMINLGVEPPKKGIT